MNPSNAEDESATHSLARSSTNIQVEEREEYNPCCLICQQHLLRVVEKLFIICGTFAISFFLFGILSLQNGGRHGDTFFLIGAGFIIILGIYMANQRHRMERLQALRGTGHTGHQNVEGLNTDIAGNNVYVVPLALPTDQTNSSQSLISPAVFGYPDGSGRSLKPEEDDPPRYEDVVSAPPPYESLNPSNLRS